MKAIVVLGQSLDPDGSAPGTLVRRVETAAELQLANPDDTLCVPTGGDPAQTGVTEAEVMRRLLVELEVPESAIRPEPRAQNTLQNAAHVLPILQVGVGWGPLRACQWRVLLPKGRGRYRRGGGGGFGMANFGTTKLSQTLPWHLRTEAIRLPPPSPLQSPPPTRETVTWPKKHRKY